MNSKKVRLFFGMLLFGVGAFAQIRVPRMVSDGMVLQRDMPIRVWGFASPGEKVTVKFGGETVSGVTDDNGKWAVQLSPKKAGGPFNMDIDGINHVWIKNIMIGEVWVLSGQMGMAMPMSVVKDKYADVIAHAGDVPIRQFQVTLRYDFKTPRENAPPGCRWEAATPTSVLSFSALGYVFARQLYEHYRVPIGLINVCAPEAPAEAWLSKDALKVFPDYAAAATRYTDSVFKDGTGPADPMAPGGLFNGMIAPVCTHTVRGIILFQGEANLAKAPEYTALLPLLINDWRRHWNEGDLPFLYVQLPAHGPVKETPGESKWAELREAQRMALTLPQTGMAVATDIGDADDVPGQNREELSQRLLLAAESIAYGKKNFISSGPLYHSMRVHGDRVHINFTEENTGLIVKGGGELKGFTVAGDDGHFVPAKATIEGKVVIVTSELVPHPVSVRYAWADNPAGANLYNRDILFKDGLPAPAFTGRVK
ncbi:sialate O-acetylesterase [Puia dinghuensis]|uniref:9-O-acetylesterase n=1 Tax=Puia dinghuensis TaxID=1792502 RepID=A0A8J2XRW0_9BACT|nr:sialate O-acetylesterase [Puia dinghuensis]GGA90586.1 9-O-acetylesterase [Puia dinghuensis]